MTYLPCVVHEMFVGLGIVALVYLVSLKHNVPSSLIVVFDIYTENPKNLDAYPLFSSVEKYTTVWKYNSVWKYENLSCRGFLLQKCAQLSLFQFHYKGN